MLSRPPASMTRLVPAFSRSCANIVAFIPDPHILLMVVQPVDIGSPPPSAAWRAGAGMDHVILHGFEWQVQEHETPLFRDSPSNVEPCRMPTGHVNRRLRSQTNRKLFEQASAACEASHPNDYDLCVDDVIMTGSLEVLESW